MQQPAVLQPRPLVLAPAGSSPRDAFPAVAVPVPQWTTGVLREWPFRVRTSIRTTAPMGPLAG